jgi:hypothetical protein
MPWCEDCARFWNPSSMGEGGHCPSCGRTIAKGSSRPSEVTTDEGPTAPWHFKLLMVSLVIYLGYRAFQGVEWVIHHL